MSAARHSRKRENPIKNQSPEANASGLSGAATQIRTGDLILTKDVLYQLSHSSTLSQVFPFSECYYNKKKLLCQVFLIKK